MWIDNHSGTFAEARDNLDAAIITNAGDELFSLDSVGSPHVAIALVALLYDSTSRKLKHVLQMHTNLDDGGPVGCQPGNQLWLVFLA